MVSKKTHRAIIALRHLGFWVYRAPKNSHSALVNGVLMSFTELRRLEALL